MEDNLIRKACLFKVISESSVTSTRYQTIINRSLICWFFFFLILVTLMMEFTWHFYKNNEYWNLKPILFKNTIDYMLNDHSSYTYSMRCLKILADEPLCYLLCWQHSYDAAHFCWKLALKIIHSNCCSFINILLDN